jgi:hypothetical protein
MKHLVSVLSKNCSLIEPVLGFQTWSSTCALVSDLVLHILKDPVSNSSTKNPDQVQFRNPVPPV